MNITSLSSPPKKTLAKKTQTKNTLNNEKVIISTNNIFLRKNIYINVNNKNKIKNIKIKPNFNNNSENSHLKGIIKKNISNKNKHKNNKPVQIILPNNYTNEELNKMDYKNALLYDKRTYIQYYYALLKKKQLILFPLINKDDYNLITLKIYILIISFSLSINVNGFFFSDETMHKIYIDNGIYHIINQIPIIVYSTFISLCINFILKMLSLSERTFLELKKEKNIKIIQEKSKMMLRCLKIKFIIFFTLSLLLMTFFWYFISCFCGVYINTQIILITDTLISFGLSMVYPFALCLIPGLLRIPSLKANKKDKQCLYKISNLISLI